MSAEVLASAPIPTPAPPAPRRSLSPAVLEPRLVNRLLGVTAAIFAVPAAVAFHVLAAGTGAPSASAAGGTLAAAVLLVTGFGYLLQTAPRIPELRTGRLLCGLLALETCALAVGVVAQLLA